MHAFTFVRIAVLVLCAATLSMCKKETPANAPPSQPATAAATGTESVTTSDLSGKKVEVEIPLQPPDVVSECRVGTKLDAQGLVAENVTTIKASDPLYVSVWVKEAPKGLAIAVRTLDAKREELARVQKDAEGAKPVTLQIAKLKPGKYVLETLWGGNAVCDDPLEVR